jgi:hypothetical protein
MLKEAKQAGVAVHKAERDLAAAITHRDTLIKEAVAEGVSVTKLAATVGLSRNRIYRIVKGKKP